MEDNVKEALLDGSATIQTKIEIITDDEENIILDEQNGVVSWDYEDFRYVKDEGWIGQFVARQVNGVVKNISDDFSMTDKEFVLHMGVKIGDNTTWYNLGNFLVNKVTDDEVNDKTSFEALDYTKRFNQTYVDSITYPCTALELAQNVCGQCGCELGNTNFKHNDWEITGNVFTNGESCREVLKAIGKLAYSWVRIDWDNKVYIDFIKNTEVNEYNKINNSNYYSLTTQKEKIGAINRVVIGYKDIEGERTKVEDIESIDANGVNEITIYDNPLVYNQELREKAIVGAEDLFGLEYLPLETLTVGHPWLKGDELVEVTNMEGKVHKTIPFDRTIQYFGHIKTKINVATNTKTNTEYAYESGIDGRLRKTEIMVDKINGQITEVIEEQDETTKKLNETISTVEETKQTISSVETTVEDITTTTQTSTGGNSLHIIDALESNALEYHIDGKSEQETSVQGNNILGLPEGYSHTSGSLTVSVEDGIIIVNGSTTGIATFDIPIPKLKLSGDYVYSISGEGDNKNNISLTLYDADKKAIGTYIVPPSDSSKRNRYTLSAVDNTVEYIHFYAGANYTFDNVKLYYMINEGTTLLPFEKFVPNSPSPNYPSKIKTIPSIRNLFTTKGQKEKILILDTGETTNVNFNTTDYLKVKSNKQYTVSTKVNDSSIFQIVISQWDSNKNFIKRETYQNTKSSSYTLTLSDTTKYVRLSYRTDLTLHDIMLEEGSIAHPYVPYGAWAKVKITGKNLFDETTNNKNITAQYSAVIKGNFNIVEGQTYTLSFDTTNNGGKVYINETYFNHPTDAQLSCDGTRKTYITTAKITGNYENQSILKTSVNTTEAYDISNIMLEQDSNATEYEAYKEKEVLIDLSKPNLFDGKFVLRLAYNSTGVIQDWGNYVGSEVYIPVQPSTHYKYETDIIYTGQQICYYKENKDFISRNVAGVSEFTTPAECYFVRLSLYSENAIIPEYFKLYEGYTDYYELSSINDTKDELSIIDRQVVIDKKIDKVILDGSSNVLRAKSGTANNFYVTNTINNIKAPENNNAKINILSNYFKSNYSTNQLFLTGSLIGISVRMDSQIGIAFGIDSEITTLEKANEWLKTHNTEAYYPLAKSQQITLPNIQIPLYEGVNHITLVDDLETTTSIKYYRNTPIAQDYVVQQQLDETNSNLSTTTDKTNQNTSDINATNTNLNNNYYNKDQIDVINSSTTQEITTIKKEVDTKITAEDLTIAINQIKTTGATSVETTTGYTFDEEGLKIQKSGSEMSSLLDNDGLVVKRNDTEMLTVRSSGVEAENITVRTYFTIGDNTRAENYKGGTGFFYIGGDN